MKKDTTLVVLAAGVGKRFWPFTTDKNVFPFMGKTFFEYAFPKTLPPEINRCVIVTNSDNQGLFSRMHLPVPHTVVLQEKPTGMAGAILAAKKEISGKRILVTIADDLADHDRLDTMMNAVRPDIFGILTVWKPATYFPGGYVVFREGIPVGIMEKPGEGKAPSDVVYFGGQYIEDADALLRAISAVKTDTDDVYEQALTALMKAHRFSTVTYDKEFVSLKYPWHVLDVMEYVFRHDFKPGKGKAVDIRNNVIIEGPVYLGNNVRIFENTKIVGPVYIGDNTIIGNGNIIRESYIGSNCVTGFNTDIARSYIGEGCWFHSNYIGDSVLEGDVSLGSGTILANLRLDEGDIASTVSGKRVSAARTKLGACIGKHVRIGVNVSTMPGVKIGSDSMVGAGVVVDADIPNQSFCIRQSDMVIKKNKRAVVSGNREQYRTKI